jgi:hypothetical protein
VSDEPKRITYLGTITADDGEVIAFDIPPNADADAVKAALVAAEEERIAAQARESRRLHDMFLTDGKNGDDKKDEDAPMSDEPRRVFVGVIPTGADATFFAGADDPVSAMVREAGRKLDAERAAEAKALAAKAADIERAANTRRARSRRKIRKALQWLR